MALEVEARFYSLVVIFLRNPITFIFISGVAMCDEAVRQTRSQKRALEREALPGDLDVKKVKLEGGDRDDRPVLRPRPEASARSSNILSAGEVKATIKVELQTRDEPVDMSTTKGDIKKEKQPHSPDDVIVLSDNEPSSPQMNGGSHFKELDTDLLMRSSPEERVRIIKTLKEELRLEEARLVLLKKLRQSQIHKETNVQKPLGSGSVATPPPLVRGSVTNKGTQPQVLSSRSSTGVIPPPLVRGGQVSKHGSQNSQIIMPPLVRGAQPISVTPQQIATLRQQQQQYSSSGPPPLLLAPRASVPTVQGQKIIQPGLIRVANVSNANLLVNVSPSNTNLKTSSTQSAVAGANESPASRQAAAKLALRKQLEKTLLEIPPPKPPAPEFNFLPSAANNEFIYLVGLEEVVQCLLDALGRGKQGGSQASTSTEPFTCTQCKTDFTCRWRKEKSGAIMCEQCMSTSQKKSLKAEHTNRLKAAFVKALQQEQEIEQRILQQASSPASHSPSSSSSSSSSHLVKSEQQVIVSQQIKQRSSSLQQHSRSNQPINHHHSTITQSSAQLSRSVQSAAALRGVSHSFSPASQLQNAVAAAALVSRPGKHAVLQRSKVSSSSAGGRTSKTVTSSTWRRRNNATPGVTMAYVNPSLAVHKSSSSAVERQREYLLDMIPSRSISQTANTWK
ncbi:transcriptional repressor p66-alpha-like isoform X1 [Hemibagrus wyckioides]|uniref:transcriptional repressor p66-alpha-like isoform X1 n=1 Tax=Hemibagrus wyckioides TaxID=337641 RepID=UPI00266DA40B|nr:transcriptional repressor p66-alpha-like isoform X1 [Hemibagrus wyckioides]